MDKSNKYDLTKFSVFISFFICDNKNEGLLLHKGNHLLLVSAILYYIPFFRISVFFFFVSLFITPVTNSSLITFLCFEKYKYQA